MALSDGRFADFRIIVAYAKSGPLYRLRDNMEAWRAAGKTSAAIFGLDQQGTSKEALELALELFDRVYVTREAGITFHPKIYIFRGETVAHAFIGSNNLTVGGTEKNFEAAVHLELNLPADAAGQAKLEAAWTELLPASCPATSLLDAGLLAQLVTNGVVVEERVLRAKRGDGDSANVAYGMRGPRSGLLIKPESPLPKNVLTKKAQGGATFASAPAAAVPVTARGLAIQIKPHHNGEIFLSVSAVLQNPSFFGWPFNGATTPKKAGNPSYPQLDPDPRVNIVVFGAGGATVLTLSAYRLNTVYYEAKHEIRITASPLVTVVPDYSVMIMEQSATSGIDYEITIHRPDSPDFSAWFAACNQTMPGGGKAPRRYGWF